MPGLQDIAPPELVKERVTFRGGDLELRGLRNREWLVLARRFPDLQKGGVRLDANGELSPDMLSELVASDAALAGIDMIAATIAMAIDQPGEETEAEIHRKLTDAEQQQCFAIIMRLTHPPAPLAESPAMAGPVGNGQATATPRLSSS